MSLFKNFSNKIKAEIEKEKKNRQALRKKKEAKLKILRAMTNTELMKIAKRFISTNPKVQEVNSQGRTIKRTPTRDELIDAILRKVDQDNIFDTIPRIKKKFNK